MVSALQSLTSTLAANSILDFPEQVSWKMEIFMYSYVNTFIQHQADKGLSLILFGVSSSHASEIQFCNSVAVDSFL